MHHGARAGGGPLRRPRRGPGRRRSWSFAELDGTGQRLRRATSPAAGVGPRRPGGGDDRRTAPSSSSRSTPSASWAPPRCCSARRGRRSRSATRSALTGPVHAVADGAAVALLAERHLGAEQASPTSTTPQLVARPRRARRGTAAGRARSRDERRGGARVQLRHDRPAQGGAPHPPLDRPRHRALGATPSGLGPDDRFQVATPPSHILGLLNLLAAAAGRRDRAAAPPLRPRRGAAPHRVRPHDPRDGGRADRAGHGQPPATSRSFDLSSLRYIMWGATPVSESVARVVTERTGVRWLPAYGASELPVIAGNPVDEPDALAARLGRPAPAGGRAAGRRPRHRRGAPGRRGRRDPGAQPVGDGRLPPGGGDRRGLRRRAGTAPATSAGSSPRAGSTSPTAPRR